MRRLKKCSFAPSKANTLDGEGFSKKWQMMNASLLLLWGLRVRGGLRKARRTLGTPKGMLLAVFAVGFFAILLGPALLVRSPRLPDGTLKNWAVHPAALL